MADHDAVAEHYGAMLTEVRSDVCSVYGLYHTFSEPVEGAPHARQCPCGKRQAYHPPRGQPVKFTDVLVDAEDLRALIEIAQQPTFDPVDRTALLERVSALLD